MAAVLKHRYYIMNSINAENFNSNYLEWIKKGIIRNTGRAGASSG